MHTPRHARSLAELEETEVEAVATALSARRRAAHAEGFPYVQVVLNEGRAAGSSLPHSHSQLFWLREPPPAVLEELPQLEEGRCGVCSILREESLEIALRGDVVALAAPAGRAPTESCWHRVGTPPSPAKRISLTRPSSFEIDPPARGVEGPVPLNAWLHTGGHWHIELVPRLTVFAGLEPGPGSGRQLAGRGGGRATPQGVGSASGLPFSSRKRRAALDRSSEVQALVLRLLDQHHGLDRVHVVDPLFPALRRDLGLVRPVVELHLRDARDLANLTEVELDLVEVLRQIDRL